MSIQSPEHQGTWAQDRRQMHNKWHCCEKKGHGWEGDEEKLHKGSRKEAGAEGRTGVSKSSHGLPGFSLLSEASVSTSH